MKRKTRRGLTYVGWGLVGRPQQGMTRRGPDGEDWIDVTGYNEGDYWGGSGFLGPDPYGVVPVYEDTKGRQFPRQAVRYGYFA